ncbi:MAG: XylR family transcriptional regulator [Planctomycetota bacterium]
MAERIPHVALLVETSRSYGRGLLSGVRQYLAEHGPWSVFMELRALESAPPLWLKNWQGDGILTRTGTRAMADAVRRVEVPTVELRSPRLNPAAPWVGVDNRAMGKIVAEHLFGRGFRHFGVCEIGTEVYFEERRINFTETVGELGCRCDTFHAGGHPEKPAEWEKHQDELADWVAALPKPVGVMACTDQLGFFLLDACARAGVAVPEEVAVVGVENEESLCTMATPTLSSVRFNAERIGYEAAALLDRLMAGERVPLEPTLIEPLGVVTRGSSDVVAIDDVEVAQAVRFIREKACEGATVSDVLQKLAISRSALERRMRAALGRSPNEEITRVRVERAKELLISTDQPLTTIARRTGFQTPQYLVSVFKRQVGVTPGAFRRRRG